MNFGEQKEIVQKYAADYGDTSGSRFEKFLVAEMLRQANAYPWIVLQETGTVTTTSGEAETSFGSGVGRIVRAHLTSGTGGDDGNGTIKVVEKNKLAADNPKYFKDTGAPRWLAPWSYNSSNELLVQFDRVPDGAYEIQFDYYKRLTTPSSSTDEMPIREDFQLRVALGAARVACAGDTEKVRELTQLIGEQGYELQQGNIQGGDDYMSWVGDDITNERRDDFYQDLA